MDITMHIVLNKHVFRVLIVNILTLLHQFLVCKVLSKDIVYYVLKMCIIHIYILTQAQFFAPRFLPKVILSLKYSKHFLRDIPILMKVILICKKEVETLLRNVLIEYKFCFKNTYELKLLESFIQEDNTNNIQCMFV